MVFIRSQVPLFLTSLIFGMTMTIFVFHVHNSTKDINVSPYIEHTTPKSQEITSCRCDEVSKSPNKRTVLSSDDDLNTYFIKQEDNLDSTHQSNSIKAPMNATNVDLPTIFMITPTYKRLTQKADMIQLCQTLMLVPKLTWIVVEDSTTKTSLITNVLEYCTVQSVHLNEKTTTFVSRKKGGGGHRGVDQRNKGLKWIRDNYQSLVSKGLKKGVVYFGDDDNTYDLRLFEEMRYTKVVSMWPVAFAGMLRYEGPVCKGGAVIKWHTSFRPDRPFPVDMAAFAVNLELFISYPDVYIDHKSQAGMLESDFLKSLGVKKEILEGKAEDCKEIYVWHTKTERPKMPYHRKNPGDKSIEV